MEKLCYKNFVWPHNPHTYREESVRTPEYILEDQMYQFQGMSEVKRVISGNGAFFGEEAFGQFRALLALFSEPTPGYLEHPIWGNRFCYFTKLEMTQEPKDNYISFTFEFMEANSNGVVPK